MQPVVRLGPETEAREFALLRWGLVPFWAKDAKIGYSTINARAEEVANKPAFREALRKRRCLVPADAFYEWAKRDARTKQPFAIGLKSGEPFAFAGLWERWHPKDGDALETFTILTTDANEVLEPVHNRMPVILEPKDYTRWLEAAAVGQLPVDLLRPFPAEQMIAWPVGDRVGNVPTTTRSFWRLAGDQRGGAVAQSEILSVRVYPLKTAKSTAPFVRVA